MGTFTFITDYLGGTYICQQAADSLPTACHQWRDHVDPGGTFKHLNVRLFSDAFDADIDELPPVALNEVANVWLFQLLIGDDMLGVHIILTDLSPSGVSEAPRSSRVSSQS